MSKTVENDSDDVKREIWENSSYFVLSSHGGVSGRKLHVDVDAEPLCSVVDGKVLGRSYSPCYDVDFSRKTVEKIPFDYYPVCEDCLEAWKTVFESDEYDLV